MNYELWKKRAEGEPVFIGYQRATNFVEAVANKLGINALDRNEDESIKMVDGFPSVQGEVIYPSKEAALGQAEDKSTPASVIDGGQTGNSDNGASGGQGNAGDGNIGPSESESGNSDAGTSGNESTVKGIDETGTGGDQSGNAGVAGTGGAGENSGLAGTDITSETTSITSTESPEKEAVSEEPGATFSSNEPANDGQGNNLSANEANQDIEVSQAEQTPTTFDTIKNQFGLMDEKALVSEEEEYNFSKSKKAENEAPVDQLKSDKK